MTITDNRDGAFGMTYTRTPDNPISILPELLISAKTALFITDESFNEKIEGLVLDAIFDFEKIASYSILPQTIILNYEYFKGNNKLPFAPHASVTTTGYTVTGGNTKFVEGGDGSPVTIEYEAGSATIPENIKRVLIKMVEFKFKNEISLVDYPPSIYHQIKMFSNWMD